MDLLSDTTTGSRVLVTRHISAEKALSALHNVVNTTYLCHSYSNQPYMGSYLSALHTYAWVLWSSGLVALLAILALFVITLKSALKYWKGSEISVTIVLAVYPVVATSAYLTMVVPRARILSEAIAQEAVMIAMYHLYCMVITECGGVDQFVSCAGGDHLETRVLPCCCWPCCVIPRPKLQKRTFTWLRYLVLQMSMVQGLIYIVVLVLWAEDMTLYANSFIYFQPFIAISILSGIWGVIMSIRAAEKVGTKPRHRFFVLQLVLLIVKLQYGFAKILPEMVMLPCIVSLHPSVFVQLIHNSVMVLEMFLLSLWAWRIYSALPAKQIAVAILTGPKRLSIDSEEDPK